MRLAIRVTALLLTLGFPAAASAHATLVATDPSDNAVVERAPGMVQLRFNEAVAPATVVLIDAEGRTRPVQVRAVDQSVLVAIPDSLPRGSQIVSYRVVSQDGHPVSGSIMFSIGEPTRAAINPVSAGPPPALTWLARIGIYLGLFAGVGGVFFGAWSGQRATGARLILGMLYLGAASALASLGIQGLDLLGLPLAGMLTVAPWRAALGTSLGPSMLLAAASVLIAGAALRCHSLTTARYLAGLAMIGVGGSLAISGHAATAPPQWLTRPAVFLHGIGVAFWIGALAPLAVMAWYRDEALPRVLKRFSAVAVAVVGMLALTGLTLACIQLETIDAIVETEYGVILSIKIALVAVLLAFAALNKFWLTPALARDQSGARPLFRSILAECLIALLILATVAGWRFTPPPRALAAALDAPLAIHIHTDAAMFQALIAPGKVGKSDFELQLMNDDASPLVAKEVTLILSLPERGIEAFERKAVLGRDGLWRVRAVPLPLPGRWHMKIDALVTDFRKVTLEDDFEIR